MKNPKIGEIVSYTPTEKDKQFLKSTNCNETETMAAIVVNNNPVNIKVFTDGPTKEIYKTEVEVSDGPKEGCIH